MAGPVRECQPMVSGDPPLEVLGLGNVARLSAEGPPDQIDSCDVEVILRLAGVGEKSPARRWLDTTQSYSPDRFLRNLDDFCRTVGLSPQLFLKWDQVEQTIIPRLFRRPLQLPPLSRALAFLPLPIFTEKSHKPHLESVKGRAWGQPREVVLPANSLFEATESYQILTRYLPNFLGMAKEEVAAQVGLDYLPETPHRIFFVDRRQEAKDPASPADQEAVTGDTGIGGKPRDYVVFYLDYLISKIRIPADGTVSNLDETFGEAGQKIRHEMVHLLMRQNFGKKHQSLPRWLKEGMAVTVASQGEHKVELAFDQAAGAYESLYSAEHGKDPRNIEYHRRKAEEATSLRSAPYAQHYLRFDFLIRRIAARNEIPETEALPHLTKNLKQRMDLAGDSVSPETAEAIVNRVIEEETGMPIEWFDALAEAENRAAAIHWSVTSGFPEYQKALRARSFFQRDEEIGFLRTVQRDFPNSFFAARSRWHEGLAVRMSDSLTSLNHFLSLGDEGAMADFPRRHTLVLRTQLNLLQEFGFNGEVVRRGEEMLTLFDPQFFDPYDLHLTIALASYRQGDIDRARGHYQQALAVRPAARLRNPDQRDLFLKNELED